MRAERFFVSARGRVCSDCRKGRVRLASRDVRLWEKYGITLAEYAALLEAQEGRCAICGGKRSYNLDVDHDHSRAVTHGVRASVRGLLCRQCNRRVLRSAKDSVQILQSAIQYLSSPPARHVLNNRD